MPREPATRLHPFASAAGIDPDEFGRWELCACLMLLPHRPGGAASDQMGEMDVFAGVHARLETVEGQDLEAIEQVFLSTQSLENQ